MITEAQFWRMNPAKLRPYVLAEERKNEEQNRNAWLYGLYNYIALSTALGNAFRGKGTKAKEYLNSPLAVTDAQKEAEARLKEERLKAEFGAWAIGIKAKFEQQER